MKTIQALALAASFAACAPLHAQTPVGSATNVFVTGVDVRSNGYFLVSLSGQMVNQPACASSSHTRVTGDATTAGGKAMLSAAMLAFSTHSPVALAQGTGACAQYNGFESLVILSQGVE